MFLASKKNEGTEKQSRRLCGLGDLGPFGSVIEEFDDASLLGSLGRGEPLPTNDLDAPLQLMISLTLSIMCRSCLPKEMVTNKQLAWESLIA